ncbi:MAG: methyltransferase domain-containing protein [Microbacterium sp.]|uniref:class I SAM-dependent methyltransferase n=1 Tax=Microbacterium sp. TaxID=51671 RepID=UPI001D1EDE65|nr:class I SAM-dependent methyltransferase [Microbacterium sp.]MBW8761547.1 methyltransferase domain-containing protein [Microbacterium sp.]
MSSVQTSHFGAGGEAPYDLALRNGGGVLRLVELGSGSPISARTVEIGRFLSVADAADDSVIARVHGPVLDVGCGPGRIVRAAIKAGFLSLGVDISRTAVEHAREQGLPVLHRSVFDPLPQERSWGTVLLLDGNIGIGGAPAALLARCSDVIAVDGSVIVEVDPVATTDRGYDATLVDGRGRSSSAFPWYDVGAVALGDHLEETGLRISETWTVSGRAFVWMVRRG